VLTPVISIVIYWFVFGTLRSRAPIEMDGMAVPVVFWLVIGFVVGTVFYQASRAAHSLIYTTLNMLSKMNVPLSVIPNIRIFSEFYAHLIMLTIAFIVFQLAGYYVSVYFIQIPYFIFAAYVLVYSFALITSTLSTLIRDVHLVLNSLLRMLL